MSLHKEASQALGEFLRLTGKTVTRQDLAKIAECCRGREQHAQKQARSAAITAEMADFQRKAEFWRKQKLLIEAMIIFLPEGH